ncbi:MAG: NAD(P)/FAD-dependent oxidoreductase [Deltaproteobacteria bacterium]|nr:NAD(P)/FAD-dependent oxidoreductase [Deltaproteobacteria bacterium]
MSKRDYYDAVVVGAGPNGLAAAITLGRRFNAVLLLEAAKTIGGGVRSKALTLPGFIHDVCSTVQPLSLASPFFQQIDLPQYGVEWIQPEIPLAHPFKDGSALYLHRSLEITADALGSDGRSYRRFLQPFVENAKPLMADILKPLRLPGNPLLMARFAFHGLRSLRSLAETQFQSDRTRALFAGLAAHAMIPLEQSATAAFAIILAALAHAVGWPIIKGGSQNLADALADCFKSHGGEIITGQPIALASDLPKAAAYFFDVTPRQLINIEGLGLTAGYCKRLARFRYGPGVYKMDWALKEPIPWKADVCRKAGTVHLGDSFGEIAASIREVCAGKVSPSPYVILAQQSLFDPSRAPAGGHTAWAYCHVPHGSAADVAKLIENKIERYAPGFREVILAKSVLSAAAMEQYNANYVGGDINGGLQDLSQLYTRPIASLNPYRTSTKNIYLCSSSTPPGGGVHGLCGYYAAQSACK